MGSIETYSDLIAWQKAMVTCLAVYHVTLSFPDCERYGLTSQMRRAAVSIPSNIAEGFGRGQTREYLRYLCIARGSTFELETQSRIARHLGYFTVEGDEHMMRALRDSGRVLGGLIRSLERHQRS
ncbi:MAG: four helix bundle protein [Phycisphaerales bacterium]|nr:four helix bundle protein [Phycisphaerales bacterium]